MLISFKIPPANTKGVDGDPCAKSAARLPADGLEGGRETLHHPPTLPPARQLAATLAAAKASGAADLSVGYDPKGAVDGVALTGDVSKVLIDV